MLVKRATLGNMGNNCYLVTDENTNQSALIDCTEFSSKMEQLIDGADLKYILLTHGHFDHIEGVSDVVNKFGAKVMISKEDSAMLNSSKESLAAFCGVHQTPFYDFETFSDGDIIKLGDTDIRVMATPGHTKGSVCFITKDAIFSGDTLFYCSCGRTDFPGGSFDEITQSLYKLAALEGDYKVYTGHDEITSLQFERDNNPYIRL